MHAKCMALSILETSLSRHRSYDTLASGIWAKNWCLETSLVNSTWGSFNARRLQSTVIVWKFLYLLVYLTYMCFHYRGICRRCTKCCFCSRDDIRKLLHLYGGNFKTVRVFFTNSFGEMISVNPFRRQCKWWISKLHRFRATVLEHFEV